MNRQKIKVLLSSLLLVALLAACVTDNAKTKKPSGKNNNSSVTTDSSSDNTGEQNDDSNPTDDSSEDSNVVEKQVPVTHTETVIRYEKEQTPMWEADVEEVSYSQPEGKPVTLRVKDFGAKGDGKTDDAKAIYKAVGELRSAPKGSVLEFESNKTYYYKNNGTSVRAVFYFRNNECLTIKGNNSLIKLGGTNLYYADIADNKDITIEGLRFDYAEYKPAFAATVQSVDISEGSAIVKADRDIHLETGENYTPQALRGGKIFGVVPADNSRYHMYLEKYKMLDSATRQLKVYFDTTNGLTMSRLANSFVFTYGFVLPMPETGNQIERGFSIHNNCNFTMKNVDIYSTCRHVFSLQYNTGSMLFDHVNVVRAPYDQALRYTSWADCYHLIHNRAKFLWKNCKNEWNYDDVFNISAQTMTVNQVYSQKEFKFAPLSGSSEETVQPGDTICILNTKTGALIGRAKVKSIISKSDGQIRVKVEKEMPLLAAGLHILCWVEDTVAPGSEFVDCDFDGTFRARSELTFTRCRFYNRRFWIGLDTINAEGPLGKNILFRKCVFEGDNAWEISSGNSNKNGYHLENIVFEKCKNISTDNIVAGAIDEIIIR